MTHPGVVIAAPRDSPPRRGKPASAEVPLAVLPTPDLWGDETPLLQRHSYVSP